MSSTISAIGSAAYKLSYEISPIILTGGLAGSMPGGMLPIAVITEGLALAGNLLGGSVPDSLDDFYAHFSALPGSTILSNAICMYPLASQVVAGNALIAQPTTLSVRMIAPDNSSGAYLTKLGVISSLVAALTQHNNMGGLYAIATPAYIWTDGVMTAMKDASAGDPARVQTAWQFDFYFPLITQAAAQAAQSTLMQKTTAGMPTDGTWGGSPSTLTGGSPVQTPGGTNLAGSGAPGGANLIAGNPTGS